MGIHVIPVSRLQREAEDVLAKCCDTGRPVVVEVPHHRRVAIHPLDTDHGLEIGDESDSLASELLESSEAFRDLLAKSAASVRAGRERVVLTPTENCSAAVEITFSALLQNPLKCLNELGEPQSPIEHAVAKSDVRDRELEQIVNECVEALPDKTKRSRRLGVGMEVSASRFCDDEGSLSARVKRRTPRAEGQPPHRRG